MGAHVASMHDGGLRFALNTLDEPDFGTRRRDAQHSTLRNYGAMVLIWAKNKKVCMHASLHRFGFNDKTYRRNIISCQDIL